MEDQDLDALFEQALAQAEATSTPPAPSTPAPSGFAATPIARGSAAGTPGAIDAEAIENMAACPRADADGVCRECTCGSAKELRERIGKLARDLHESLKELNLDKTLAEMAVEIPDARNRLKYVTEMCERSAQKVLDTLDELTPLQDDVKARSQALLAKWERMLGERERPDSGFMALFEETRSHLAATVAAADKASTLHTDILMAQDFQDLTGQVCRKIEGITERMETQLVHLLIDTAPADHRKRHEALIGELEGPQVTAGRSDAVESQAEVDDLLSSLGF